jgi:hypothetical protein
MSGLSDHAENAFANSLRGGGNGSNVTAPAALYAKLHTGDPGEAGTSNAAATTTRVEVQFGAASGGVVSLSNSPSWTNLGNAETITHLSIWDNLTAGNCWGKGSLSSSVTVAIGDTLTISAFTITLA